MSKKTENNTPPKSDLNQHTGNQKKYDIASSHSSKDREVNESLEDIAQKADYIGSKPEVQGTGIPSCCQKVKKYCKLLITYLSDSFTPEYDAEDTDKTNNTYEDIKRNTNDLYKRTQKLFGIASNEQLSDPSLLKDLQEGMHELSKDIQKLYKFVVDNLKKLAVKIGIRKETKLEKARGAVERVVDKAVNSSLVSNVVEGANSFTHLLKRKRRASSKDQKINNYRGRS